MDFTTQATSEVFTVMCLWLWEARKRKCCSHRPSKVLVPKASEAVVHKGRVASCEIGVSLLARVASSGIYCDKIWEEVEAKAGTVL